MASYEQLLGLLSNERTYCQKFTMNLKVRHHSMGSTNLVMTPVEQTIWHHDRSCPWTWWKTETCCDQQVSGSILQESHVHNSHFIWDWGVCSVMTLAEQMIWHHNQSHPCVDSHDTRKHVSYLWIVQLEWKWMSKELKPWSRRYTWTLPEAQTTWCRDLEVNKHRDECATWSKVLRVCTCLQSILTWRLGITLWQWPYVITCQCLSWRFKLKFNFKVKPRGETDR